MLVMHIQWPGANKITNMIFIWFKDPVNLYKLLMFGKFFNQSFLFQKPICCSYVTFKIDIRHFYTVIQVNYQPKIHHSQNTGIVMSSSKSFWNRCAAARVMFDNMWAVKLFTDTQKMCKGCAQFCELSVLNQI